MRDAFLKILNNPALNGKVLIQAEDITRLGFFSDAYEDILEFETDLAEISEIILLFCESEGSLAELGAFSVIEEIASRMLVIVRDKHWSGEGASSFVRLGPLRYLERKHGQSSVFVIDDRDIGVAGSAAGIRIDVLRDQLQSPLASRLATIRNPTTFSSTRPGHIIKLIVGMVQEYGALTIDEIDELLLKLDVYVPSLKLKGYLLCAEAANWVVKKRKGSDDFYVARPLPDSVSIVTKTVRAVANKGRRRMAIREHWKAHQPLRYSVITEFYGADE
ncbi:hypothetical protein CO666_01800 [Rhizobium chutanense]|uniref:Uncharacterized protein n=2 Tax=Rhizobium chutanense TaxID=2035448 RepID=A0A2A6JJW6_9HYPH|nr:hypothetical protein CO666_01800 [Rhizobium chutanense]